MAESEPKFLARLREVFTQRHRLGTREQDYTDTAAYAEEFIQEVSRLYEGPLARKH
jgi:hypothetical protein